MQTPYRLIDLSRAGSRKHGGPHCPTLAAIAWSNWIPVSYSPLWIVRYWNRSHTLHLRLPFFHCRQEHRKNLSLLLSYLSLFAIFDLSCFNSIFTSSNCLMILNGSRIPEFETLASWFRLFPTRLNSTKSFLSNGVIFLFGKDFPVHFLRIYSATDSPMVSALTETLEWSAAVILTLTCIVFNNPSSFFGLPISNDLTDHKANCKQGAQGFC